MIVRQISRRHGVAAIDRATVIMGPLTMVVPDAEFSDWLKSADIGGECIYAHGPQLPKENAVCLKVYELAQSGELMLFQKRGDRGQLYHARLVKRGAADPEPERGANNQHREIAIAGTEAGRVLDILKRCANFDRQVPSLTDLASQAGLADRQRANYLKTVLEEKGLIEIIRKQGCVQVIRIVSSGKSTRGGV